MDDRHNVRGVISLLGFAASDAGQRDDGMKYLLDGDLNQMSIQREFLLAQGFSVGQSNVYPCFSAKEDFDKAITLIWELKISGWWHYKDKLVELGVCTTEAFDDALSRQCARSEAARRQNAR